MVVVVLGLVGLGVIIVGVGVIVGEAVGVAVGGGSVSVMVGVGVNSTRKAWASWIHAAGNASDGISSNAIKRIQQRYTWKLHAKRLMDLSRIYGFWKYITNLERDETRRYLEMFYHLQYRPMALKK